MSEMVEDSHGEVSTHLGTAHLPRIDPPFAR